MKYVYLVNGCLYTSGLAVKVASQCSASIYDVCGQGLVSLHSTLLPVTFSMSNAAMLPANRRPILLLI